MNNSYLFYIQFTSLLDLTEYSKEQIYSSIKKISILALTHDEK